VRKRRGRRGRPLRFCAPSVGATLEVQSSRKQAVATETYHNCGRVTDRGKEAGSESAGQRPGTGCEALPSRGERANDREASMAKARRCRSGGRARKGGVRTWGDLASRPKGAGIQALVNQHTGARQGNPNFVYYRLAAAECGASGNPACNSLSAPTTGGACTFYDVTVGDMDVNCRGSHNCYTPSGTNGVLATSNASYSRAYAAGLGWDFATGIGTVNAFNLVNNWSTP
jgi:hypothetical protein